MSDNVPIIVSSDCVPNMGILAESKKRKNIKNRKDFRQKEKNLCPGYCRTRDGIVLSSEKD